MELIVIYLELEIDCGFIKVIFFKMNYSILDCFGIVFYILEGIVVYIGDFKFDLILVNN